MAVWGRLVQRAEMDDAMSRRLSLALHCKWGTVAYLPPPLLFLPHVPVSHSDACRVSHLSPSLAVSMYRGRFCEPN